MSTKAKSTSKAKSAVVEKDEKANKSSVESAKAADNAPKAKASDAARESAQIAQPPVQPASANQQEANKNLPESSGKNLQPVNTDVPDEKVINESDLTQAGLPETEQKVTPLQELRAAQEREQAPMRMVAERVLGYGIGSSEAARIAHHKAQYPDSDKEEVA